LEFEFLYLFSISDEWGYYFEAYPFPVIFNGYNTGETYQVSFPFSP